MSNEQRRASDEQARRAPAISRPKTEFGLSAGIKRTNKNKKDQQKEQKDEKNTEPPSPRPPVARRRFAHLLCFALVPYAWYLALHVYVLHAFTALRVPRIRLPPPPPRHNTPLNFPARQNFDGAPLPLDLAHKQKTGHKAVEQWRGRPTVHALPQVLNASPVPMKAWLSNITLSLTLPRPLAKAWLRPDGAALDQQKKTKRSPGDGVQVFKHVFWGGGEGGVATDKQRRRRREGEVAGGGVFICCLPSSYDH